MNINSRQPPSPLLSRAVVASALSKHRIRTSTFTARATAESEIGSTCEEIPLRHSTSDPSLQHSWDYHPFARRRTRVGSGAPQQQSATPAPASSPSTNKDESLSVEPTLKDDTVEVQRHLSLH